MYFTKSHDVLLRFMVSLSLLSRITSKHSHPPLSIHTYTFIYRDTVFPLRNDVVFFRKPNFFVAAFSTGQCSSQGVIIVYRRMKCISKYLLIQNTCNKYVLHRLHEKCLEVGNGWLHKNIIECQYPCLHQSLFII